MSIYIQVKLHPLSLSTTVTEHRCKSPANKTLEKYHRLRRRRQQWHPLYCYYYYYYKLLQSPLTIVSSLSLLSSSSTFPNIYCDESKSIPFPRPCSAALLRHSSGPVIGTKPPTTRQPIVALVSLTVL